MNSKFMRSAIFFILLLFFSIISAADVYINGVLATGALSSQEFKNCTVRFDEAGNIFITVPGVKIMTEKSETLPRLKNRYFITISAGYPFSSSIKINVNGKNATELKPGENNLLSEISSFLKKGENSIVLTASSEKNKIPISLVVGTGTEKDGSIQFKSLIEKKETYSENGINLTLNLLAE